MAAGEIRLCSKQQFQRKLQLSRIASSEHFAKGTAGLSRAQSIEVGMVQDVESLRPELQGEAFAEFGILEQVGIPALRGWSNDRATFLVSGADLAGRNRREH